MGVLCLNKIDGKELLFIIKLNQQRFGAENKMMTQGRTGKTSKERAQTKVFLEWGYTHACITSVQGKKRSDIGIRGKKNYIDLALLFLIIQHLPEMTNSPPPCCQRSSINRKQTGWKLMLLNLGTSWAQHFETSISFLPLFLTYLCKSKFFL